MSMGPRTNWQRSSWRGVVIVEASAAAHGGKESDFVAGMEKRVPGGKFLVVGGDERRTVFGELGIARGVESEELFDGGGVGRFDGILSVADDFLEAAEKENFEASGLGNGGHAGIVARVA
jgi:hypothetical protein